MGKDLVESIRMRIKGGVPNTIKLNSMSEQELDRVLRKYIQAITDRESIKDDIIRLLKEHIKILEKEIELLKKEKND
jgi:acetone carboxylase gamma subunit